MTSNTEESWLRAEAGGGGGQGVRLERAGSRQKMLQSWVRHSVKNEFQRYFGAGKSFDSPQPIITKRNVFRAGLRG